MAVAPVGVTPFSREKLLQVARTLPADLQVLSALGEMLQDVNSELEEVATLLRRDVALAARIVRISNSPVYGGGGQVASIEDAVNRVGFSEILKLVGTATASRFAERSLDAYGITAEQLRDNMLYGAIAAEALARVAGADTRVAYTAGLLRPLGLMVLDRASRGTLKIDRHYTPGLWDSYSSWEGSVFGINNCEVAALILQEWRFPAELCGAVRGHHLTQAADFERPVSVLINLANHLADQHGRALAGEVRWWARSDEKLKAAGVAVGDIEAALVSAEDDFAVALAALSA